MDAYLNAWRQYAVFTGRSPRKEFWVFYLVNTLVIIAFSLYAGGTLIHPVLGIRIEAVGVIAVLFGLAVLSPPWRLLFVACMTQENRVGGSCLVLFRWLVASFC